MCLVVTRVHTDVCVCVCVHAVAAMWQLTQWKQIATVAVQLSITSQQIEGAWRPKGQAPWLPADTRHRARPLLLANWSFPWGQASHLCCLYQARTPTRNLPPCIIFNTVSPLDGTLSFFSSPLKTGSWRLEGGGGFRKRV